MGIEEPRFKRISDEKFKLLVENKEYKVINCSESGVCFKANNGQFKIKSSIECQLFFNDLMVYSGKCEVNRIETNENSNQVSVHFEAFVEESTINACLAFNEILINIKPFDEAAVELPPECHKTILWYKSYLEVLKSKLDAIENKIAMESNSVRKGYFNVLSKYLSSKVSIDLSKYAAKFHKLSLELNEAQYKFFKELFRFHLTDLMNASVFMRRSNTKPLGYAGDFVMMSKIYDNEFEGNSYFEKIIFNWSVNLGPPKSVRFRRGFFCTKILSFEGEGPFKIASIACGPAREIQDSLEKMPVDQSHKFSFFLYDQDKNALNQAKSNFNKVISERSLKVSVKYLPISVRDILKSEPMLSEVEKDYNLVYSAGLYDYLPDDVGNSLTKTLFSWLDNEGELIIGNFSKLYPNAISDFLGDWKLICRDEQDFLKLFNGIDSKASFHKDDEGLEILGEIRRTN